MLTTGQFLNRLCGNDFSLRLKVDRVLCVHAHPVELAALESQPLRQGAEELYITFFSRVVTRLMFSAGPGTDEWRTVIAEERAFFNVVMARCRAMRLPVKAVENAGFLSFQVMEELKPIGEQLEEVLGRMRDEMFRDAFGVRLSEN